MEIIKIGKVSIIWKKWNSENWNTEKRNEIQINGEKRTLFV